MESTFRALPSEEKSTASAADRLEGSNADESAGRQQDAILSYLRSGERQPIFLHGDALSVLRAIPSDCIDFAMTSPPYWGQRAYSGGGIGLEATWQEYIENLLAIIFELKRVLKTTGSFWLNIGDAYQRKSPIGIPWRIALAMTDQRVGCCAMK